MASDITQSNAQVVDQKVMLNIDEAVERMGDKEIYLDIARYFANHLPQYLHDLTTSLAKDDSVICTRLAHSLKGNCATVGAEELRQRCLTLEQLCREGAFEDARAQYSELMPRLLSLRDALLGL